MRLYGWRPQTGPEMNFLIEQGDRLIAIEAKWGRRIEPSVLNTFQRLRTPLGARLACGVVLYGGDAVIPLGPQLLAIPHALFFTGGSATEPQGS
jgi:hypothetical protein